ncbi:conserved hypothetical protein [Perkinsus marinus ATCC 50983]|uniref:Uncharacterized protein n=1 Tax=Perkinsus marinus (strain ATCC 50983 / TXsc) TaxID=423536 RepID=C5LTC7_PERM5|nr:conserved hypothetical protein [Perkinsus marinus ATCC 50983]EER00095.1 conserved hypothetical protein [Perkinsus marinus ATCC 50983]|eukprot:XP_002767377.1 conserved hypothetical protein [Perkinsus marinus ATCC 50983]
MGEEGAAASSPYALITEEGENRESAIGYTGKATAKYSNGDVYEGYFDDGKKAGDGVYTHGNGDVYEGSYKEGKRHGVGRYTMGDAGGGYYHGSFAKGLYDGKGTMMYSASGDVYSGEWKEGLRHGLGTYVYRKGQASVSGRWEDDRLVEGEWRLSPDHNSPVYEGKFDPKWVTAASTSIRVDSVRFGQPIGDGVWKLPCGQEIAGRYIQSHTPSDITDEVITTIQWASSNAA